MRRLVACSWIQLFALALVSGVAVAAQSSFDAASVRPSPGGAAAPFGASFKVEGNRRLVADGATLRDLIARAYSVQDFQIVTPEDWMAKARFDVKGEAGTAAPSARPLYGMLREVLVDRFGLKVRVETKPAPVYALVVDGPLRAGMRRSSVDCTAAFEGRELFDAVADVTSAGECQARTQFVTSPTGARITISRPGMSMTQLAEMLTPLARRVVVDETDLRGTFDIQLAVSPESTLMVTREGGAQVVPQAEGLSVASAVREQLGLRLRASQGPAATIVVEQAHAPTAD